MIKDERIAQGLHQMIDIEARVSDSLWRDAPLTAAIELARILSRFHEELTDEQCGLLLTVGAALIRTDREISKTATAQLMGRLGLDGDFHG